MLELIESLAVYEKTVEGKKYFFAKLGDRGHGVPEVIVWLSKEVAIEHAEDGTTLDLSKVALRKTAKGGWIFVPAPQGEKVVIIGIKCGYRGNSYIHCNPISDNEILFQKFHCLDSPRGNLGISEFTLFNIKKGERIKLRFENSGRHITAKSGEIIVTWDGCDAVTDDFPFELEV
ncbi:MAG: hypothetical protein GYA62_08880 [Bacteroidales bacterium]|nr:hypothetical protein [Bacteroidales bacterium]